MIRCLCLSRCLLRVVGVLLLFGIITTPLNASFIEDFSIGLLFKLFINHYIKPLTHDEADAVQAKASFLEKLKSSEEAFGHLPEYWELRAFFDLRPEDEARGKHNSIRGLNFEALSESRLKINPLMLEKALALDAKRPFTLRCLRSIQATDSFPDGGVEYYNRIAKAYADAGVLDPENGYYPFFEASIRGLIGEHKRAIELFDKAASCEKFSYPKLYPLSYAIDHIDDFEEGEGFFSNLSFNEMAKIYFLFFFPLDCPSYLRIRESFEAVIAQALVDGEWATSFTTLNRAACRFGKNDYADWMDNAVAITLIWLTQRKVSEIARESGDKYLEIAAVNVYHEMNLVKQLYRNFNNYMNIQNAERNFFRKMLEGLPLDKDKKHPFGELIRFWGEHPLPDDTFMFGIMAQKPEPILEILLGRVSLKLKREFNRGKIWPIYNRLETLDYADPKSWYESWYKGNI